jgi:hypothetical protein
MKFATAHIGAFVSLCAIAAAAPAVAQSNGQSANDLRLPDSEREAQAKGLRVERDEGALPI